LNIFYRGEVMKVLIYYEEDGEELQTLLEKIIILYV
jgi:hypothetical protein